MLIKQYRLALIAQVLETSVAVFMRRGFGCRYLGTQAALVIPMVLLFSVFWEGHDVQPLLGFLVLFLLACAEPVQDGIAGDFTLPNHLGEEVSLSDFQGEVILLDLSAFW